jgi:hypothetical protein
VKKARKLTQLELANNFVKQMQEHLEPPPEEMPDPPNGIRRLHRVLEEQLAKAQNLLPEGESDGSISESHWFVLYEVARAALGLIWAIERWEIGKGPQHG